MRSAYDSLYELRCKNKNSANRDDQLCRSHHIRRLCSRNIHLGGRQIDRARAQYELVSRAPPMDV
jgi:hypothetical protein